MSQFIDDFYEVLFKPFSALNRIVRERTAWQGLLVYIGVSLISAISAYGATDPGAHGGSLLQYLPPEAAAAFLSAWPLLNLFVRLLFAPFFLFVPAAILHFVAELYGGKGQSLSLAAGLGYSQLPYVLVAPFGLLAGYLQADLVWLVNMAAFFWTLFLKIEVIRTLYGFSKRRAVFVYFLPFIAGIAALAILLAFSLIFFMPIMSLWLNTP